MMLRRGSESMRLAIAAAVLRSAPAAAETRNAEPPKRIVMNGSHVIVGNYRLSAPFDDAPEGRDCATLPPIGKR